MLGRLINGHQQTDPKRRVKAQEHRHDVTMPAKPVPVKTKSTFEINNLKKRDVTMLHVIWLGEITIRHGRGRDSLIYSRTTQDRTGNAATDLDFLINSRSV